jgi:hypothetical protein
MQTAAASMAPTKGLGTLNLDILSTYLKLQVLWTVKSPTRKPMALDALRARLVPLGRAPRDVHLGSAVARSAPSMPLLIARDFEGAALTEEAGSRTYRCSRERVIGNDVEDVLNNGSSNLENNSDAPEISCHHTRLDILASHHPNSRPPLPLEHETPILRLARVEA